MPDGPVTIVATVKPTASAVFGITKVVNKDGNVNILDIVVVVNYSLCETDETLYVYDVNGDGNVNILDIVMVVNKSQE